MRLLQKANNFMKICCIFLLSLVSTLFTEYSLYAAKFINRTERSIMLYSFDGKVLLDTLVPTNDTVMNIESCKAHIRGDREYIFEGINQQESIIFAEVNDKIIITRIETKD